MPQSTNGKPKKAGNRFDLTVSYKSHDTVRVPSYSPKEKLLRWLGKSTIAQTLEYGHQVELSQYLLGEKHTVRHAAELQRLLGVFDDGVVATAAQVKPQPAQFTHSVYNAAFSWDRLAEDIGLLSSLTDYAGGRRYEAHDGQLDRAKNGMAEAYPGLSDPLLTARSTAMLNDRIAQAVARCVSVTLPAQP